MSNRVIRLKELAILIGVSPSTINRWEKAGKFPERVKLGENSTGWLMSEIEGWLSSRQRGGVDAPAAALEARAAGK